MQSSWGIFQGSKFQDFKYQVLRLTKWKVKLCPYLMQYWDKRFPELGAAKPQNKHFFPLWVANLPTVVNWLWQTVMRDFLTHTELLLIFRSLHPFLVHWRKGYNQLLGLPGCVHVERSAAGWTCQSGWNCCYKLSWHFQRPPEWGCRNKAMKIWLVMGNH